MAYYDWRADIEDCTDTVDEDTLYRIGERIVEEDGEEDDPIEAVSNVISIWRIDMNSDLYDDLLSWYGNDEENLLRNVRSSVISDGYLYFVTGCGYRIFSADLLGGTADGEAERKFEEFI
jgi:hypothetical protein